MNNSNVKQNCLKGLLLVALAANVSWDHTALSKFISTDLASKDGEVASSNGSAASGPVSGAVGTAKPPPGAATAGNSGTKPDPAAKPAPNDAAQAQTAAQRIYAVNKNFCGHDYRIDLSQVSGQEKTAVTVYRLNPEVAELSDLAFKGTVDGFVGDTKKMNGLTDYLHTKLKEKLKDACTETADSSTHERSDRASRETDACKGLKSDAKFSCQIDRLQALKIDSEDEKERRKANSELNSLMTELRRGVKEDLVADTSICRRLEDSTSDRTSRSAEKKCDDAQERRDRGLSRLDDLNDAVENLQDKDDMDEKTEVALDRFQKSVSALDKLDDAVDAAADEKSAEQKLAIAMKSNNPMAIYAAQMEIMNRRTALAQQQQDLDSTEFRDWTDHLRLRSDLGMGTISRGDFNSGYSDIFNVLQLRPLNMTDANSSAQAQAWSSMYAPDNANSVRRQQSQVYGSISNAPPRISWISNNGSFGNRPGSAGPGNLNQQGNFNRQGPGNFNQQQGPGRPSTTFPGGLQGSPQINSAMRN